MAKMGLCCDTEVETVARTPTGEGIVIAVGHRQLTSRLKAPKPSHQTGLWCSFWYANLWATG
ncbi:hypothetical protein, partial [Aeromonas veronii]